jgi:hypothetical protein
MATNEWKRSGDKKFIFFDKGIYPQHHGIAILQVRSNEAPSYNKYFVWEFYREFNDRPKERKLFKTQAQVMKYAKDYMRKH